MRQSRAYFGTATHTIKKISIIGSSGSGKTALAVQLGEILGLDVIHLDAHFWSPGWVPAPREQWAETVQKLISREAWIIDGNFSGTMDMRLEASDAIIFLDFPRTICLWRAIKRRVLNFGKSRPDMGPGCPERFLDIEFFQFLKSIWSYPKDRQPDVMEKLRAYSNGRRIIILSSPDDVSRFLGDVRRSGALDAWRRNVV